jgi:hypothetical protein
MLGGYKQRGCLLVWGLPSLPNGTVTTSDTLDTHDLDKAAKHAITVLKSNPPNKEDREPSNIYEDTTF